MDFITLIFGLVLGFFIGAGAIFIYFKLNNKNEVDIGSYSKNLKDLEDAIKGYENTNSEDRGKIQTLLQAVQTGNKEVKEEAEKIANTFISGGGQKQGVWGEIVLNNILTNNLGFREGHEFVTQKNFNTDERNLQPDVIINYPDGKCMIVDSKVSLTAWDEYANSSDERIKEDALKRHKQSLKNHVDSLNKKNYQGIKDLKTLDTIIMFCPNEKALELPDKGGQKLMEYALSKKVTLCGPSMLFLVLKVAEYFWKADKQSKNILNVIELANKISSQTVDIYNSAKKAQDSFRKTSDGITEVMDKIKDGKGSLLSKTSKINKIGGLTPKKLPPADVNEDDYEDNENDDEDKNNG
jgi:DNA recombination protein RmuC